jgi:hypothetical protein
VDEAEKLAEHYRINEGRDDVYVDGSVVVVTSDPAHKPTAF